MADEMTTDLVLAALEMGSWRSDSVHYSRSLLSLDFGAQRSLRGFTFVGFDVTKL